MKRIATPIVGDMITATALTLVVIPAICVRAQVERRRDGLGGDVILDELDLIARPFVPPCAAAVRAMTTFLTSNWQRLSAGRCPARSADTLAKCSGADQPRAPGISC